MYLVFPDVDPIIISFLGYSDFLSMRAVSKYFDNMILVENSVLARIHSIKKGFVENVNKLTHIKNLKFILKFKPRGYYMPFKNKISRYFWDKISDNVVGLDLHSDDSVSNDKIEHLVGIKYLGLSNNMTITGDIFGKLRNIRKLDLWNNKIVMNKDIAVLSNLEVLILGNNNMVTNEGLYCLTNLMSINLQYNKIVTGEIFKYLTNITKLNIRNNNIIRGDEFSHLNIVSLNLIDNSIVTNNDISHMTNMIDLDLSNNKIINRDTIKNFTNLQILGLYCNKIITNRDINNLTSITNIGLHNCNISDIGIKHLTSLEILRCNNISGKNFKHLTNITHLYIDSHVSNERLQYLTNLKYLTIHDNDNKYDCIKNLTNITSLTVNYVSDNDIVNLTNLIELDLACYSTVTIPYLTKIKYIHMSEDHKFYSQISNLVHIISH